MSGYWTLVEPYWSVIEIGEGAEVFQSTFGSVPRTSGLLYAAHFCRSEVGNGGFRQFFGNNTGVLAPEAVKGFREIDQMRVAELVQLAMDLLNIEYPRERKQRQDLLSQMPKSYFSDLEDKFFTLIESEAGGFARCRSLCSGDFEQK